MDEELCPDCVHSGTLNAKMKTIRLSRKAYEIISKLPGQNPSCNACRLLAEMLQNQAT